jgi:hypothetical protein
MSVVSESFRMIDNVTWKPNQVFEKSESRGRHLQRMLPFCLFGCVSIQPQGLCWIDSCNPQFHHPLP